MTLLPPSQPEAPVFERLASLRLETWSRPARLNCLEALAILPLADTEILHTAHHAPIAVAIDRQGPRVVAIVHPRMVTAKHLNAAGRWSPPYMPMALRCLPFRSGAGGETEIASDLIDKSQSILRLSEPDGKASAEFQAVLDLLDRIARGGARLATAAKFLILADVLSALHPLQGRPELRLFVANSEKLRALASEIGATLTADGNLPFELAAASIFSLRHLDRKHINDALPPTPRQIAQRAQSPDAKQLEDAIDQPVIMDTSPLFSFDEYFDALGSEA